MMGCPPQGDHFKRYFDWPDAVIPIQFDEPNIAEILSELDAQPDYLQRIRTNNVMNTLRKHDWVYRWEQILHKLGLPTTHTMAVRQTRLKVLASELESTLYTQKSASGLPKDRL